MRIDGLTVCAGEAYAGHLARSLPVWLDTLDSLTVVTRPDDHAVRMLLDGCRRDLRCGTPRLVTTGVFGMHGAHFNKGAALCAGYAAADPSDWVLHFDSDVLPPPGWRVATERSAVAGNLHGLVRVCEFTGRPLDETPVFPYGYFHLWHGADPVCRRWPLFAADHGHAGHYDADFAELWPRERRTDLGLVVRHLGEPRTHWFGPDGGAEGHRRMREFHAVGLRNARLRAGRDPAHRLRVPPPLLRAALADGGSPRLVRHVLRACALAGPWCVRTATVPRGGPVPAGHEVLDTATLDPCDFEDRVLRLARAAGPEYACGQPGPREGVRA